MRNIIMYLNVGVVHPRHLAPMHCPGRIEVGQVRHQDDSNGPRYRLGRLINNNHIHPTVY